MTRYGYDEANNLIAQTDANNHTTRYEYDSMGRRTKRMLPLGQTELYAYDLAGNLTNKTDFNGKTARKSCSPTSCAPPCGSSPAAMRVRSAWCHQAPVPRGAP